MARKEEIYKERIRKIKELKKIGVEPFAYNFNRTHKIKEIIDKYSKIKPKEKKEKIKVKIAGRIRSTRGHGKAMFADLEDYSGKIQTFFSFDSVGKKQFKLFQEYVNIGDIVGAQGFVFKTQKGELSIWVKKFELLTKSLRGLPSKWAGLKDVETKYRRRYLDLLMNSEVRKNFEIRTKVIQTMRKFLVERDYIEVETPILQPLYGGALARPFVTHHNTLDRDMYLRISNEMYLKRLIAGGFEKVFEFSVDFRNEGIDTMHNPEFLMLESMTAYSDYKDGMKLFEESIEYTAKKVLGTTKVSFRGKKIDLKTPWKRLTVVGAVKKYLKLDVEKLSIKDLVKYAERHGVELLKKKPTKGELVAAFFEEFVECKLIQPTIIYDYPVEISPLAKRCRNNPNFTERFEVFICGAEYGNNYTEITDPIELRNNFKYQLKRSEAGDKEAHPMDEDFLRAMEHGMPPTCGLGFGVDRFVMLFTNSYSIRDVILFPQLRAETKEKMFGDQVKDTVLKKVSKEEKSKIEKPKINRQEAWNLVKKYNKDKQNLNHYLESEIIMRFLAKKLGEDEDIWGLLGLLHDIDWELIKDNISEHTVKSMEILKKEGFDDEFIEAICSHNYGWKDGKWADKKRTKKVHYALAAAETVTGLIYAYALMRGGRITDMKLKGLKKKFKDKSFASKVDRNIILECEKIGLSLDDFLQLSIDAIKSIAKDVSLE